MINLNNVSLVFQGGSVALSNITTSINEGEFVYLVGHSGSGKSSFLKLLYKDYISTKGDIEVAGLNVVQLQKWKIPLLRRKLGIVTQEPQLLEKRNTYENISFALEVMGSSAEEIESKTNTLLDLVELNENAFKFPDQLSGGEQTRVSIARALANNPLILLCDEPTGNLDPDLSIQIVALLEKINRAGTTVVMATHDSSIVNRRKKRVIELSNGKIVGFFNHRMEWGPRALGNRSILARPDTIGIVKKINEAVKNRDFWMPFALRIAFSCKVASIEF